MSNIAKAFANGKAFIPFITCGDPDLETTAAAVRAMAANGADLIELGIPFSDPTAEGPVIQGANIRALKAGTTTDKVFDFVREVRKDVSIPMVFMTYANVVFSYGAERFISTCAEIGIDGLILPDLPYEEKEEFALVAEKYGLDLISLKSQRRLLRNLCWILRADRQDVTTRVKSQLDTAEAELRKNIELSTSREEKTISTLLYLVSNMIQTEQLTLL